MSCTPIQQLPRLKGRALSNAIKIHPLPTSNVNNALKPLYDLIEIVYDWRKYSYKDTPLIGRTACEVWPLIFRHIDDTKDLKNCRLVNRAWANSFKDKLLMNSHIKIPIFIHNVSKLNEPDKWNEIWMEGGRLVSREKDQISSNLVKVKVRSIREASSLMNELDAIFSRFTTNSPRIVINDNLIDADKRLEYPILSKYIHGFYNFTRTSKLTELVKFTIKFYPGIEYCSTRRQVKELKSERPSKREAEYPIMTQNKRIRR